MYGKRKKSPYIFIALIYLPIGYFAISLISKTVFLLVIYDCTLKTDTCPVLTNEPDRFNETTVSYACVRFA